MTDSAGDPQGSEGQSNLAADDEPTPEPAPEAGDVTEPEVDSVVSHDDRPELPANEDDDSAGSPAEQLFGDSPSSNDDASREEER